MTSEQIRKAEGIAEAVTKAILTKEEDVATLIDGAIGSVEWLHTIPADEVQWTESDKLYYCVRYAFRAGAFAAATEIIRQQPAPTPIPARLKDQERKV